jgi:hypothetical protein
MRSAGAEVSRRKIGDACRTIHDELAMGFLAILRITRLGKRRLVSIARATWQ